VLSLRTWHGFFILEVVMPYAVKGNTVVKKDTGKVVGHSKNPKKYIQTLRALENGWEKPTGRLRGNS